MFWNRHYLTINLPLYIKLRSVIEKLSTFEVFTKEFTSVW